VYKRILYEILKSFPKYQFFRGNLFSRMSQKGFFRGYLNSRNSRTFSDAKISDIKVDSSTGDE